MASKAKLGFKTPLLPLSWVTVRGLGKLKMNAEDNKEPENYNYVATVTYPDEEAMKKDKAVFDKFWRENKPAGATKQSYDMFKPEMRPVLDEKGKPKVDEDDAVIKEPTGRFTLTAKTITHWQKDGKQNIVKLLGSNGKELQEGHPLESGCGEGTLGILHGTIGINEFPGNMGLAFYLNGVQIKDSSFTEYTGGDNIDAETIEDDVADTDVEESTDTKPEI